MNRKVNPRNARMTLGTARDMVANPDAYRPDMVREARALVAYWAKRQTRAAAANGAAK